MKKLVVLGGGESGIGAAALAKHNNWDDGIRFRLPFWRIANSISTCSYLDVPVVEKQKHICTPPSTYMFPQPLKSRRPRIEHIVTAEHAEFESIGICRTFVPEAVLAARIEHEW